MVRSAQALLAVLILPGFLLAQQAPRTHTVVDGDTLWDLANTFYGNPFDWRRIWNVNQADVRNPNLILPGQVLTIPGVDAQVTDVTVEVPSRPMVQPPAGDPEHTIFHRGASAESDAVRGQRMDYVAVSRDQVYSAPWMVPEEVVPQHLAVLSSFATGSGRSETPRSYDRVFLEVRADGVRVGSQFRTYRVNGNVEDVGDVVVPTGLLTVTDVNDEGAVAVVTQEYDRISLGDFVGALPSYQIERGRLAEAVTGGSEAMIMGFAGKAVLADLGAIAFLDLGSDQGITIGDEFEYLNTQAGENVVEGRLQVVGVTPGMASARVIALDDAVFEQGVVVRLSRRMR